MDAAVRLRTSADDSKQAADEDDVLRREVEDEVEEHSSALRFADREGEADEDSQPLLSSPGRSTNGHGDSHQQRTPSAASTHQQRYSAKVRQVPHSARHGLCACRIRPLNRRHRCCVCA